MIDPETKKTIDDLQAQINGLKGNQYRDHRHTGFDASRVKFSDLDTVFYAEGTIDPPSLGDGTGTTRNITVQGVSLGDFALVSAPYSLQGVTVTAYVSANDTVAVLIQNESGGTVDLASGIWRSIVIRKLV